MYIRFRIYDAGLKIPTFKHFRKRKRFSYSTPLSLRIISNSNRRGGPNRKCATGFGGYREGMAAMCFHFIRDSKLRLSKIFVKKKKESSFYTAPLSLDTISSSNRGRGGGRPNRKCATGLGGYRKGMAATCFHFIAIPLLISC